MLTILIRCRFEDELNESTFHISDWIYTKSRNTIPLQYLLSSTRNFKAVRFFKIVLRYDYNIQYMHVDCLFVDLTIVDYKLHTLLPFS